MRTKCYPIITDFFGAYDAKKVPYDHKWRVFQQLGEQTYLMVQNISGEVKFSPLFIQSFPLLAPHHLLESEKFNIKFSDPSQITEISVSYSLLLISNVALELQHIKITPFKKILGVI